MGTFYQFPPAGAATGSYALPSSGLDIDYSFRHGKPTNITVVCVSGTPVIQYWDNKDNPSIPTTVPVGQGYHDVNVTLRRFTLTGSATVAVRLNDAPSDTDIQSLLSVAISGSVATTVTNTVNTDVGTGTASNPNIILKTDQTGIAAAVTNQTANFTGNKLPKATDGGVLTGTS